MKCPNPNCSYSQLKETDKFCSECGSNLRQASAQSENAALLEDSKQVAEKCDVLHCNPQASGGKF